METGGLTGENDYVTRVLDHWDALPAADWDALLVHSSEPGPFARHAYLRAMVDSGSATPETGWGLRLITLWRGEALQAACAVQIKAHSYGEYVFDWAWANAYAEHGLNYYPKALVAVPFTPVPGARLLAVDAHARRALVRALVGWCRSQQLSSLHLLFLLPEDVAACEAEGLMTRHTVQFHWRNEAPTPAGAPAAWPDWDAFLASLQQDKRKKIRQERRKVAEAGVRFRWAQGRDIPPADWAFFYRCYERTYLEHGNPPYLTPDFFARMARDMPEHWLLFIGERGGQPIASSLIAIDPALRVAYGRYWGALQRVDCLHFEACYYQPLQWCLAQGYRRFEGGAQGEHKMARALLPVKTTSAHWLAHPAFAEAVDRFLQREGAGVAHYLDHLAERNPLKAPGPATGA